MAQATRRDTIPCLNDFDATKVEVAKAALLDAPGRVPELLAAAGVSEEDWLDVLRAAIESLRGTASASTSEKSRFVDAILSFCQTQGLVGSWEATGSMGRDDYRVELSDGTLVGIESKGCPDGNNTNIWDRPSWADEFVIWSQCPHSLVKDPGNSIWSGIATQLLKKEIAEPGEVADTFIFWNGRCGTAKRPCPKRYGVIGELRSAATDIPQDRGWVPPPCIYLLPKRAPTKRLTNPPVHTLDSVKFGPMLLRAFNVPSGEWDRYVHSASVETMYEGSDVLVKVSITSRAWPDGVERVVEGRPARLKRDT